MMMQQPDLEALLDEADAQLSAARASLRAGAAVDLQGALGGMEEICARAVADQRRDLTPRLQQLIDQLSGLETALRQGIELEPAASDVTHRQAAELYGSATTPKHRS